MGTSIADDNRVSNASVGVGGSGSDVGDADPTIADFRVVAHVMVVGIAFVATVAAGVPGAQGFFFDLFWPKRLKYLALVNLASVSQW